MLHFTDQALEVIHSTMANRRPAPAGLRLGVVGNQCSGLRYIIRLEDSSQVDDQLIQCQDLTVFVDSDSLTRLQGVTVDFIEREGERGFSFDNPNMSRACSECHQGAPT